MSLQHIASHHVCLQDSLIHKSVDHVRVSHRMSSNFASRQTIHGRVSSGCVQVTETSRGNKQRDSKTHQSCEDQFGIMVSAHARLMPLGGPK